ncbi:MAG: transposase [Polyangiaceae bacterium]|nr:transposase [Polyangiaceae bacterium]
MDHHDPVRRGVLRGSDATRETIAALIGTLSGVLVTDRGSQFGFWAMPARQVCWAHLIRKFVSFSQRKDEGAQIGDNLLLLAHAMLCGWHRVRDGTLSRRRYQRMVREVLPALELHLDRGVALDVSEISGACRNILEHKAALFTFAFVDGVDPTNNAAERALRPFVLWRKVSYGSQSLRGVSLRPAHHDRRSQPPPPEAVGLDLSATGLFGNQGRLAVAPSRPLNKSSCNGGGGERVRTLNGAPSGNGSRLRQIKSRLQAKIGVGAEVDGNIVRERRATQETADPTINSYRCAPENRAATDVGGRFLDCRISALVRRRGPELYGPRRRTGKSPGRCRRESGAQGDLSRDASRRACGASNGDHSRNILRSL